MCKRCDGWSEEEIFDWYRSKIQDFGWMVIAMEADEEDAAFAYTIGLTRYHGHPEIVVSGLPQSNAGAMLNDLGSEVGLGTRFASGQLTRGPGRHRFQFIQVDDPGLLVEAQELYSSSETGLVPALQVVYTDHNGRWPWDQGSPGGRQAQPLFGTPLHQ